MSPATRKLFLRVHLWLGLPAAAVYLVVAITGALLVYEKDLDRAWHPELWRTDPAVPAQSLDALHLPAQAAAPGLELKEIRVDAAPGAPVEFRFDHGPHVRLDPGTGALLGTRARGESFFGIVEKLHKDLVLGPVGKWIVTTATVVLLALLATGLVLWWPKQWRMLKGAVTLALDRKGRALHFNLHNTLGFWSALPLVAVAGTGALMAIKPIGEALRGPDTKKSPPAATSSPALPPASFDAIHTAARRTFPAARELRLHAPHEHHEEDPGMKPYAAKAKPGAKPKPKPEPQHLVWRIEAVAGDAAHEHARSMAWIDPRSAAILRVERFDDLPLGARLRALARPLHDGSLWGRPSQFIALLAVLVLPVLSVTGVALWWLRRRVPAKKPSRVPATVRPAPVPSMARTPVVPST